MPEFRIEECTYARSYDVRVMGEREVPVAEYLPTGFRTYTMEFEDFEDALIWCEDHSTPEREYAVAE